MTDPSRPGDAQDPLQLRLDRAHAEAAERAARLATLEAPAREALLCDEILELRAALDRARAEIEALRASRSWRLTRPLRALGHGLTRRG